MGGITKQTISSELILGGNLSSTARLSIYFPKAFHLSLRLVQVFGFELFVLVKVLFMLFLSSMCY